MGVKGDGHYIRWTSVVGIDALYGALTAWALLAWLRLHVSGYLKVVRLVNSYLEWGFVLFGV